MTWLSSWIGIGLNALADAVESTGGAAHGEAPAGGHGAVEASVGMSTEIAVVSLLVVASAVAMLVRRIRLPYTVALVLAGLALGSMRGVLPETVLSLHLSEELLMAVFLPALLFEAAFHVNFRDFRANIRAILLLALPGVAIGILLVGGAMAVVLPPLGLEVSFLIACLIASILAATDPVSVIALFKELGAPKRLALIVEGESLLNDGIAVVAFTALAAAAGIGSHAGEFDATWLVQFALWEVGGGLLIGLVLGGLLSWVLSLTEDHLVEITLTTVVAYGGYLIAAQTHASGVIAVVFAGMMCGNFGARFGMSPASRGAVISFWEYIAFAVNSLVFLLIGSEVDLPALVSVLPQAIIVFVILTLVRAGVVWAVAPIASRYEGAFDKGWRYVLTWGGLRGGISMVLALWLAQQAGFEQAVAVRDLVFAVVLIILLVQGTTIGPVLKRFGLVFASEAFERAARLKTEMKAARAALKELDHRFAERGITEPAYHQLREYYAGRQAQIEESLADLAPKVGLIDREIKELREQLASVEKDAIRKSYAKGAIKEDGMRELIGRVDESLGSSH